MIDQRRLASGSFYCWIDRKPDANTLRLARLGSHSELFG